MSAFMDGYNEALDATCTHLSEVAEDYEQMARLERKYPTPSEQRQTYGYKVQASILRAQVRIIQGKKRNG